MAAILYKWLLVFGFFSLLNTHHPIFVSVTEIAHNTKENTLEISCKIFTDDLETTLRKKYKTKVDLLDASFKNVMGPMINDYIQKHLSITSNSTKSILQFVGFEQQEEGIITYFEVKNVTKVDKLEIVNNILYETKPQQMGIIHVTAKGIRKSSRLNNPDAKAEFTF